MITTATETSSIRPWLIISILVPIPSVRIITILHRCIRIIEIWWRGRIIIARHRWFFQFRLFPSKSGLVATDTRVKWFPAQNASKRAAEYCKICHPAQT
ncbi:hypothetical protein HanIR_Chr02g0056871 [Helianthus annuus]|nr:hypothetical protein HanIR_Chr02g0056871 [Helianthus annuus]